MTPRELAPADVEIVGPLERDRGARSSRDRTSRVQRATAIGTTRERLALPPPAAGPSGRGRAPPAPPSAPVAAVGAGLRLGDEDGRAAGPGPRRSRARSARARGRWRTAIAAKQTQVLEHAATRPDRASPPRRGSRAGPASAARFSSSSTQTLPRLLDDGGRRLLEERRVARAWPRAAAISASIAASAFVDARRPPSGAGALRQREAEREPGDDVLEARPAGAARSASVREPRRGAQQRGERLERRRARPRRASRRVDRQRHGLRRRGAALRCGSCARA